MCVLVTRGALSTLRALGILQRECPTVRAPCCSTENAKGAGHAEGTVLHLRPRRYNRGRSLRVSLVRRLGVDTHRYSHALDMSEGQAHMHYALGRSYNTGRELIVVSHSSAVSVDKVLGLIHYREH